MMLSLQPANPATIKWWRNFAFANAGTSGLLGVVNVIHKIFPVKRLRNFPDYESFIYVAFAIAIITGLFLLILNKVIAVSFAQLGGITSLVYIGYSLIGIFSPTLLPVFYAYISVAVLVIIIVVWPKP